MSHLVYSLVRALLSYPLSLAGLKYYHPVWHTICFSLRAERVIRMNQNTSQYAELLTGAVMGIEAKPVSVEINIARGLPAFNIVGLPDASIRESRERIRAAIQHTGCEFPLGRITANLAPGDTRKEGPSFDLSLAVGILAATGQVDPGRAARYLYIGELRLDGTLQPCRGVLPIVSSLKEGLADTVIVPPENGDEAAAAGDMEVLCAATLADVVAFLKEEGQLERRDEHSLVVCEQDGNGLDFADVRGQAVVKRALEVAAAGNHNVLMVGTPGAGKTMLARRVPGILPAMSREEWIEVTKIYSAAGLLQSGEPAPFARPFRTPHHTIGRAGLVGGGCVPMPGEVSLAHRGVLFLDEIPEFNRPALESLREPLESGEIILSRVLGTVRYPARFLLMSAANPCPCGYLLDSGQTCTCDPYRVRRYRSRISGPLLDRIDIHVEVSRPAAGDLLNRVRGEGSREIRDRVLTARQRQKKRLNREIMCTNANMNQAELEEHCRLAQDGDIFMRHSLERLGLSARAFHKVLRVARTIADLEDSPAVSVAHLAEAVSYRCFDRGWI